jgi:hypothetical protein
MGARGRKSAASLEIVTASNVERYARPLPPPELDEEQAAVWRVVVDRLPADWFPAETFPLLAAYCRHAVAARRIAELIRDAERDGEFSVSDYDRLLKMQERESRALASLAVKMRISQSTAYDRFKKRESGTRKPWQG